jgi:hypothetical protein
MPAFLRLTHEEYQAVAHAYPSLPPRRGYRAFRSALADALRGGHPSLAGRVARLGTRQVRLLREHLEGRRPPVQAGTGDGLTWREWQAVANAGAWYCLLEGGPDGFREFLLRHIGESSPPLAGKLSRLEEYKVLKLYLAVRSGRRCCL